MSHKITKINKIPLQSLLGYGLNDQYECHTVLYTGSFISVVFWRDIDLNVLLYGMLMEWIQPHFVILESWIECRSFMYTGVLKIGSDLLEIGAWKELLKIDSILLSWEVGLNVVVYVLGIEEWIWPFGMWSMDHCWCQYYPKDIYIHARRQHARYQEMNGNEAVLFWLQSFVKAYGPREKSSAAQKTVGSS